MVADEFIDSMHVNKNVDTHYQREWQSTGIEKKYTSTLRSIGMGLVQSFPVNGDTYQQIEGDNFLEFANRLR